MTAWTNGLRALVGVSALLTACTAEDPAESGMQAGTYAVTGFDLGSCAEDTWLAASTTMTSLVVEERTEAFVVSACSDQGCVPTSPGLYVWSNDRWNGQDGGAYLTDNGCLVVHVDATAYRAGNELVIEAERWSTEVVGGSCTFEAVKDLSAVPCAGRTRLTAVQR